ncbi:DUF1993 domain-containing protein [Pseudanabaena catenata USMAC16]|uniref:DUF1993 domain-containing protein n=3 Tax=Pseudanabaenaceae TaxID=1890436 RepID=L8MX08_9CYAN|nr:MULTISPECIES: DUF1993 domain-containing protein [Pseudanabaena]ELS31314.1 protein of unknown function DUF1993-containing protein [Pseudanabaena biceps PCC 7429]MDG3496417.1 DUF1993 domain-containing protein [Pseudanabaena catenata USMAC16]
MTALQRLIYQEAGESVMTISMYQVAVPSVVRSLNNLIAVLEKGAAHAEAKKIDPSVLIASRLYPDMLPLSRQVQIASDIARRGIARLAGTEAPALEDNETTFAELGDRLRKVIGFIETFTPEQIDGSEEKVITLPIGKETMTFAGQAYLLFFILPNVYFHVTTAYDILRHCGVELGKLDFLGARR